MRGQDVGLPTKTMYTLSLFSGAGGLDLGLHLAVPEARVVCYVEQDAYACAVLATRMEEETLPPAPVWSDVSTFRGEPWRGKVHCIVGGFPCFVAGTLIHTKRGFLPIESVEVGDFALTHLGRWRRVTAVMSRTGASLREIRGTGFLDTITTDEHPYYTRQVVRKWNTDKKRNERIFSQPEWISAKELDGCYYDKNGAGFFVGHVLPPEEADDHSADFWWLVGRYLADGWRVQRKGRENGRVVICCRPEKEAALWQGIQAAGYHATRVKCKGILKFHITKGDFYEFLGPFGTYAHGKALTSTAIGLTADKSRALYMGWASGDGSQYDGHIKTTTTSRELALGMALVAHRAFGVVASIYQSSTRTSCTIEGRTYAQRPQFDVDVNQHNRSSFIEGIYGWKRVRSVESRGIGTVYNISVDEDESYIANGAIVHNCTDISGAGKQAGIDGPESGLWREFARIIGEVRPRLVFIENVAALVVSGLGRVLGDLARLGYDAEWCVQSAASVGAPHQRRRLFLLAHANGNAIREQPERDQRQGRRKRASISGNSQPGESGTGAQVDANRQGQLHGEGPGLDDGGRHRNACVAMEHAEVTRLQAGGQGLPDERHSEFPPLFPAGPGEAEFWTRVLAEYPDLAPATQSPLRRVDDELASKLDLDEDHRGQRLRCLGNGVVPLAAAVAFLHLSARLGLQWGWGRTEEKAETTLARRMQQR